MASLRTAFMQTFCTGSSCLSFLSSFSSLLSHNYDDHSNQEIPNCGTILPSSVSDSFRKIQLTLKSNKDRATWIDSFYTPSLVKISDNTSSDFSSAEQDQGHFVHVLDLTDCEDGYIDDLDTVLSEHMSLFEVDPTSTSSVYDSDEDFSQVVDI